MRSQLVLSTCIYFIFFFFKQKTAYEIGTGDWSSDVCSSDLAVYQFKNNSFEDPYFDFDKYESQADFKAAYIAEELKRKQEIGRASCRERV